MLTKCLESVRSRKPWRTFFWSQLDLRTENLVLRVVSDHESDSAKPYRIGCQDVTMGTPVSGKSVAVVGSGITGLGAAYILQRQVVACAPVVYGWPR